MFAKRLDNGIRAFSFEHIVSLETYYETRCITNGESAKVHSLSESRYGYVKSGHCERGGVFRKEKEVHVQIRVMLFYIHALLWFQSQMNAANG